MNGYETAVWLLVALPVLMGLLALPFKKKWPLLAIVGINTVIMTILSLYLLTALLDNSVGYGKPLQIKSEDLAVAMGLGVEGVNQLILALDALLLVVFIGIGVWRKSAIVAILGVCQLLPLLYFEMNFETYNEGGGKAFTFALDYLSLVFVLISSIIGSLIALYAVKYMEDEHKQGQFMCLILAFLGVMNGAVFSNNMLHLYFFWECTTFCCYFLIAHEGNKISLENAKWAAEVTMAGGAALLLGTIMFQLYNTRTISLAAIVSCTNIPGTDIIVALPLFFASMAAFTISAQVPFQSWLRGAMDAPTPVSALLQSSTMVNLGVYMVIRMAPAIHQFPWLALMIAVVGGYSFVSTALLAIHERRMKRLLALSTVGNLGLIIMLAAIGTPESIAAAVILTLFHAISKALLFLSAGTVQKLFGRNDMDGTEGQFRRVPSIFSAFFIGILTMFLAPFGVFIAKYAAITESASNPFLVIMVVIGSIACEVFYVRWLGRTMALTGKPVEKKTSPIMTYPMWTLAIGAIVFSVFLPFFMASMVNPIVSTAPGLKASEMFIFIQLNYTGFIPTFLLFVALLFIVGYATQQTDVRKDEPSVAGKEAHIAELSCPYFDDDLPNDEPVMKAEAVGLCVMVATLVIALWAGGMF